MKKIIFTILTLNLFLFNSYSQIDVEVLKTIEEWKGETKKHQFEENVLIDISVPTTNAFMFYCFYFIAYLTCLS